MSMTPEEQRQMQSDLVAASRYRLRVKFLMLKALRECWDVAEHQEGLRYHEQFESIGDAVQDTARYIASMDQEYLTEMESRE